jgi:hypothetical protein
MTLSPAQMMRIGLLPLLLLVVLVPMQVVVPLLKLLLLLFARLLDCAPSPLQSRMVSRFAMFLKQLLMALHQHPCIKECQYRLCSSRVAALYSPFDVKSCDSRLAYKNLSSDLCQVDFLWWILSHFL